MRDCFGGFYAGRRVLVTGHTGFKGSWLCLWLRALGAEVGGLALPPPTSPSHWRLLALEGMDGAPVDLADADAVRSTVTAFRPDVVFHLAAQPLVLRGYREPVATFATNVLGLVHLLEAVRATPTVRAFVNVTTDKVYRESAAAAGAGYREDDPLGGHDPYSASKACAELVSECWRGSFFATSGGPASATARAGNVIGGGDWAEDRLVPDLVRAATGGGRLSLRNPQATRPWQHVLEPLSGYLLLARALTEDRGAEGGWNFGPRTQDSLPVSELVQRFVARWPGIEVDVPGSPHASHEAAMLRLDSTRAVTSLGWRPVWDAETAIERTVAWYRQHDADGRIRSDEDLLAYVADARRSGLAWAA